jgi:hypothetical protein
MRLSTLRFTGLPHPEAISTIAANIVPHSIKRRLDSNPSIT